MERPSSEIAGPPKTRATRPLHNSVVVSLESFQILSLVPVVETYRRYFGPSRGEEAVLVVREIRAGADTSVGARESAIRKRQSVFFGVASVATRRRPSALAAREV